MANYKTNKRQNGVNSMNNEQKSKKTYPDSQKSYSSEGSNSFGKKMNDQKSFKSNGMNKQQNKFKNSFNQEPITKQPKSFSNDAGKSKSFSNDAEKKQSKSMGSNNKTNKYFSNNENYKKTCNDKSCKK